MELPHAFIDLALPDKLPVTTHALIHRSVVSLEEYNRHSDGTIRFKASPAYLYSIVIVRTITLSVSNCGPAESIKVGQITINGQKVNIFLSQ